MLRDGTGDLQLMLTADGDRERVDPCVEPERRSRRPRRGRRRGRDLVGAASCPCWRRPWTITAKCLRPLPDKRRGLSDPEAKVRQRYVDLIVNSDARRMLRSALARQYAPCAITSAGAGSSRSRRRSCSPCTAAPTPGRSSPTSTPTTCGSTCASPRSCTSSGSWSAARRRSSSSTARSATRARTPPTTPSSRCSRPTRRTATTTPCRR